MSFVAFLPWNAATYHGRAICFCLPHIIKIHFIQFNLILFTYTVFTPIHLINNNKITFIHFAK